MGRIEAAITAPCCAAASSMSGAPDELRADTTESKPVGIRQLGGLGFCVPWSCSRIRGSNKRPDGKRPPRPDMFMFSHLT